MLFSGFVYLVIALLDMRSSLENIRCSSEWLYCTFLHNNLYTNSINVTRHPDVGHSSDRHILLKDNNVCDLVNKANLVHNFSYYVYFFSLHVSGDYVPIIRRNNSIYVTLGICHSVLMTVWYAGWNETKFNNM